MFDHIFVSDEKTSTLDPLVSDEHIEVQEI